MASSDARTGWLAAVKAGSTTLSPDRDDVIAYDLEGRPTSWMRAGRTFKRSLSSAVFGRQTVAGVRRRWRVSEGEGLELFARAQDLAREAETALSAGAVAISGPLADPAAELTSRLQAALAWTPERLLAEGRRFDRAYAPVSILPPDQYGSVVLQATFGCTWNRCTYCTFYQDRPFGVRPVEAFEAHVEAVGALLGRAASARTGIFLADGNALVLANTRLRPLFAAARAAFPQRPIAGFVDVFGGERTSLGDWQELRALGLHRVAIGVETGHDPLLAYLDKPGGAADAAAFVSTLKAAGIGVAVILMVGVGGRRFAVDHERDTAELLARLPLDHGDIVYLSPFVRHEASPYDARAAADGLADLGEAERAAQDDALRRAARRHVPTARIARYHIDEFVY